MDCFGTYFTHAQSCDNVRVQSASGHMLNFRDFAFSVFVFSRFPAFAFACFRGITGQLQVQPSVFAFSRFAGGIRAARTQISRAQHLGLFSTLRHYLPVVNSLLKLPKALDVTVPSHPCKTYHRAMLELHILVV